VYFIQLQRRKSVNLAGKNSTPHYIKHSLSKLPERAGGDRRDWRSDGVGKYPGHVVIETESERERTAK
jgi:hypothetical protein